MAFKAAYGSSIDTVRRRLAHDLSAFGSMRSKILLTGNTHHDMKPPQQEGFGAVARTKAAGLPQLSFARALEGSPTY